MQEFITVTAYNESARKRLAHIRSHLDGGYKNNDGAVQNIVHGRGNPRACAMSLFGHAQASAMLAWFGNYDLHAMKQWCYVAGKLHQLWYQMQENEPEWGRGFPQLLLPLLSDHPTLIDWFAHYDLAYDMTRVENHKTHDYWAYQAIVAIRGDWPRLIKRCEKIITEPPGASKEQKYIWDHYFYLALAQGDIEGMQKALQEIVSPRAIRARLDYETGYTADLISTPAVIYAKIAWRHGYKIELNSPYIPTDWLSVEPLIQYENLYSFLK